MPQLLNLTMRKVGSTSKRRRNDCRQRSTSAEVASVPDHQQWSVGACSRDTSLRCACCCSGSPRPVLDATYTAAQLAALRAHTAPRSSPGRSSASSARCRHGKTAMPCRSRISGIVLRLSTATQPLAVSPVNTRPGGGARAHLSDDLLELACAYADFSRSRPSLCPRSGRDLPPTRPPRSPLTNILRW